MNGTDHSTESNHDDGVPAVPLCVDLDGTLTRSDLLWESVFRMLRSHPLRLVALPVWWVRGRAHLKQQMAAAVRVRPACLPFNPEFLEHLRHERARGRRLLLVTASHASPAGDVARHLALFDDVIATDGRRNLKGENKRLALVERFGEGGFDYAGDSVADLAVWPSAREAILVNPSRRVLRRLEGRAKKVFDLRRQFMLALILRAMRVRQWIKNLLLFLPMLLAHRYLDPQLLLHAALGFVAFGLGASAVYVFNDLLDVEADRQHPEKCRRPFASGELSLQTGLVLIPVLVGSSLGVSLFLPRTFLLVLGFYMVVCAVYTLRLKEIAILDVLVLAALFTTRIIAGREATGVEVSEWLLAFSMFLFLSLAGVKRYGELLRLRTENAADVKVERRGYYAGDLELIVKMGISSGYMAVLVLTLYITSDAVTMLYERPAILWLICPLLLYWISRMWLLAHRGQVREDPLSFAVTDKTTWVLALASMVIMLVASRGL